MLEEIFVTLVGFFRRGKAGEHAHGPEFAAVSGGVNAACVGWLAGESEIFFFAPVGGKVGRRIETADGNIRDGAEAGVAGLIKVCAGRGADRLFGSLFKSGGEGFLGPLLFGSGGI